MIRPLILISFLILIPAFSFAQDIGITGSSQFQRQLDSFIWNYNTGFERNSETYSILFSNRFNSRFSFFDGEVRNIQDENTAQFATLFWLNPTWGLTAEARSYRFSNTNVKQDFAIAGVSYRPMPNITVSGLGGFIQDERSRLTDNGFMGGLRGSVRQIQLGDFTVASTLFVDYADISPRTLQTYRIQTAAFLELENFSLEGDLQLARNIRDSYQASSFFNREINDFVESIQSDTTGINLSARFPLFEQLQSRLDINYLTNVRSVTNQALFPEVEQSLFDTRILRQQFNIRFQSTLPVRKSWFTLGFNYSVGARDAELINTDNLSDEQIRRRTEILLNSNFDQSRFELFTINRIQAGQNNSTILAGNVSIMNYDTPGINRDDRDELFLQARLMNEHRFSEFFRSRITLAGEAVHSVYLFSERSIENNWRRSIRLIPEFEWEPFRWLHLRQQLLVRANYTVEDFELPGRQKNDQVSREFAIQSQVQVRLDRDWWLDLEGSRSELRIGRLLWKEFKEIPTDTLVTYDSRVLIAHRSGALIASVGIRYYKKWDYLPRATIVANDVNQDGDPVVRTRSAPGNQTTVQWGPIVQMRLPLYKRNELIVNGWYQIQAVRQQLYTEYPEEFRDVFMAAERRARKRTYPNLEIIARFRL